MRTYLMKIANSSTGCTRWVLGLMAAAAMLATPARGGDPELPLDLGSAGDFVILAKTGISTVPSSDITGDMGVSPIDATAITGFDLILDGSTEFSTSAQVNGKIYASDYGGSTPVKMTTAISDMETAYGIAAGRPGPDTTEWMGGNISGLTIPPGLHKWSSGVLINTHVWLDAGGNPDAIFIFQIEGDLTMASNQSVFLLGGAQAKNIFWQVAGGSGAVIGTDSHFEGIILTATAITLNTRASFNGKLLAQTRVNLDKNNIMDANLISPPQVVLEIVSEHGLGTPSVGIYTNDYGTLLTNSITVVETIGGTQYVNTGWTMTGNEPFSGNVNTMGMVHTNDAVLTWQWSTNYLLDASATAGGMITGDTNGFYEAGASVSVSAAPDPGFWFVGWTGDVGGATNDAAQNLTMDQARTLVAHFDTEALRLEIVSEHGVGTPPVGIYYHDDGTTLVNSVTGMETLGGAQYVNSGWTMTGNEPVSGNANTMEMVITNNAVLTWQWSTNYLLTALAGPGGEVTGSLNGFYPAGTNVTVTAQTDPGYFFTFWTGDFTGSSNVATQVMTMDQSRTLVAHFLPEELGCGTPVTLRAPGEGAFMELDLSAMFPGTGWTYGAVSALPGVMSAAIMPEDKLRLEALSLGVTFITVNAVKPGDALLHAFPVQVVGHPNVLSIEMVQHEPWNPRFEQRIVVRNDTGIDCPAIGLRLLFSDIQPGIVIENQTGLAPSPDDRPMMEWSVDFPNGATQSLSVIYLSTGAFRPDEYPPTVEVQYILTNVPLAPDPAGAPNIDSIQVLADGRVVLEFTSIPGNYYEIDHTPSLLDQWQTVQLLLQAGANRTQWIDYGPPVTPPLTDIRFYRVRGVAP